MASCLCRCTAQRATIATLGRGAPFNVWAMTHGGRSSLAPARRPGLWRMRRAEVAVITVGPGRVLRPGLPGRGGPLAGLISALVVVALGRRCRRGSSAVASGPGATRSATRTCIVARGVMVQRLSVVPYGRMQFVEVTAGPIERLFQLSTVKLHTAAAASDARIPGLETAEAARLRDRLTELGESMAAGM